MEDKQPYDIRELAHKWMEGSITAEEKVYFDQWYNHFDFSRLELTDHWADTPEEIKEKIRQYLQSNIRNEQETEKPIQANIMPLWLKRAAAVAAIVLLAGGIYWFQRSSHIFNTEAIADQDVQPGGNKAMLTLSNGATIILDNSHNGQVASQGNIKVMKINSGLLVYQTTDEKQKAESSIAFNTLTTPRGGQYRLVLPDGTRVWLNAASSIRYPTVFTKERIVEVTGEAYFEVMHNAGIPFKVKAGNELIEDIGTHFNVNAYTDEPDMKITLLEGSIKVMKDPLTGAVPQSIILQPGQQAQVNKDGQTKLTADVDLDEAIAWKNGNFSFNHTSIYEVMRQISRWYNVDVNFQDSLNVYLGGSISKDVNVSEVFKMLELAEKEKMKFKLSDKVITVMKQ